MYDFRRLNSFLLLQETIAIQCVEKKKEEKIWEKLLMVEQRIAPCCKPTEPKYGQI